MGKSAHRSRTTMRDERVGRPGSVTRCEYESGTVRYEARCGARYLGIFGTVEEAEAAIDADVAANGTPKRGAPPGHKKRRNGGSGKGQGGGPDTRAVRNYLESLRVEQQRAVQLPALDGFPRASRDPDVVAAAADAWAERAREETAVITQLAMAQRVLELRSAAHSLSRVQQQETLEAAFVEHAAAYASRMGISREAFRSLGVPAAVLDAAGV